MTADAVSCPPAAPKRTITPFFFFGPNSTSAAYFRKHINVQHAHVAEQGSTARQLCSTYQIITQGTPCASGAAYLDIAEQRRSGHFLAKHTLHGKIFWLSCIQERRSTARKSPRWCAPTQDNICESSGTGTPRRSQHYIRGKQTHHPEGELIKHKGSMPSNCRQQFLPQQHEGPSP